MDLQQSAFYAAFAIGGFSAGYAALSIGNRKFGSNRDKLVVAAIVGIMITIAAIIADVALMEYIGLPGGFPIAFVALFLAASGVLMMLGAKPPQSSAQPQLQAVEVPVEAKSASPKKELSEVSLFSDFNGKPMGKEDKLASMVASEERAASPKTAEKPTVVAAAQAEPVEIESARIVPEDMTFLPAATEKKRAEEQPAVEKEPVKLVAEPVPQAPRQEEVVFERISINKGVEKVTRPPKPAEPLHPRRLYAQAAPVEATVLKEEKPPAELVQMQQKTEAPQPRPRPVSEKEELELVSKDIREQLKHHAAAPEELSETKPPESRRPAVAESKSAESHALIEPQRKTGEALKPQELSMSDFMGGKPAEKIEEQKPKSLFDSMEAINKPEAKPAVAATPFEKGSCPNCSAKTGRVVFCPHCGNGMCAGCATSITPGPEGFDYVCPTCGEKVAVRKKA